MRRIQIAVLGSSKGIVTNTAYKIAYEVGKELAKQGCLVLTGGGLGVMEAALKGAKEEGGITLAIVPWENPDKVNSYADVVVATGIGWSRNSINLNSCDGAIVVGGGAGTLNEATYAYMQSTPIIAIKSSGGIAKEIAGQYFDKRKTILVHSASNAKDAVKKILELVSNRRRLMSKIDKDLVEREEKEDWKIINKNKGKELNKKPFK